MRFAPLCLFALAPVAAACSSEAKVLNISVETGWEEDAMKKAPAVARVEVRGETPEGVEIKAETAPGGDLDVGLLLRDRGALERPGLDHAEPGGLGGTDREREQEDGEEEPDPAL